MFVAIDSHMRDKSKTNTLSPILFSRHSAAMLADGLTRSVVRTDSAP